MTSQLDIEITSREPLRGVARRFGFGLPWLATPDGDRWLIEVARGHSLGPGGRGAFEVVTSGDWPGFVRAVTLRINREPSGPSEPLHPRHPRSPR